MRLQLIVTTIAGTMLLAGPAAANDQTTADASNEDSRIICKKLGETGSLVKKNKQCFTQAEWDRIAESQRRGAERLVHDLTTKKGDGN